MPYGEHLPFIGGMCIVLSIVIIIIYMIIVLSLKNKYTIPYHVCPAVCLRVRCQTGSTLRASGSERESSLSAMYTALTVCVGPTRRRSKTRSVVRQLAALPTGQYLSNESPMKMGIFSRKIVPLLAIRSQVPVSAGRFYVYSTYIFY